MAGHRLLIDLPPNLKAELDELLETKFKGKSRAEVIRILLKKGLLFPKNSLAKDTY